MSKEQGPIEQLDTRRERLESIVKSRSALIPQIGVTITKRKPVEEGGKGDLHITDSLVTDSLDALREIGNIRSRLRDNIANHNESLDQVNQDIEAVSRAIAYTTQVESTREQLGEIREQLANGIFTEEEVLPYFQKFEELENQAQEDEQLKRGLELIAQENESIEDQDDQSQVADANIEPAETIEVEQETNVEAHTPQEETQTIDEETINAENISDIRLPNGKTLKGLRQELIVMLLNTNPKNTKDVNDIIQTIYSNRSSKNPLSAAHMLVSDLRTFLQDTGIEVLSIYDQSRALYYLTGQEKLDITYDDGTKKEANIQEEDTKIHTEESRERKIKSASLKGTKISAQRAEILYVLKQMPDNTATTTQILDIMRSEFDYPGSRNALYQAITALKNTLAEQEQETVILETTTPSFASRRQGESATHTLIGSEHITFDVEKNNVVQEEPETTETQESPEQNQVYTAETKQDPKEAEFSFETGRPIRGEVAAILNLLHPFSLENVVTHSQLRDIFSPAEDDQVKPSDFDTILKKTKGMLGRRGYALVTIRNLQDQLNPGYIIEQKRTPRVSVHRYGDTIEVDGISTRLEREEHQLLWKLSRYQSVGMPNSYLSSGLFDAEKDNEQLRSAIGSLNEKLKQLTEMQEDLISEGGNQEFGFWHKLNNVKLFDHGRKFLPVHEKTLEALWLCFDDRNTTIQDVLDTLGYTRGIKTRRRPYTRGNAYRAFENAIDRLRKRSEKGILTDSEQTVLDSINKRLENLDIQEEAGVDSFLRTRLMIGQSPEINLIEGEETTILSPETTEEAGDEEVETEIQNTDDNQDDTSPPAITPPTAEELRKIEKEINRPNGEKKLPVEKRDPNIRQRLQQIFTSISETSLGEFSGYDATVRAFPRLQKHIERLVEARIVKPTMNNGTQSLKTSDIAALIYYCDNNGDNLTRREKKGIVIIAKQEWDKFLDEQSN